jgi:hypothetical protein
MKPSRTTQETSLEELLVREAQNSRERADKLPPGTERDVLLEKARQADTAAHMIEWINSPGLQPPE